MPIEVFHAGSDRFLTQVGKAGLELICPAVILPEAASGIVRPTSDTVVGQQAVTQIITFPNPTLAALTAPQANADA